MFKKFLVLSCLFSINLRSKNPITQIIKAAYSEDKLETREQNYLDQLKLYDREHVYSQFSRFLDDKTCCCYRSKKLSEFEQKFLSIINKLPRPAARQMNITSYTTSHRQPTYTIPYRAYNPSNTGSTLATFTAAALVANTMDYGGSVNCSSHCDAGSSGGGCDVGGGGCE